MKKYTLLFVFTLLLGSFAFSGAASAQSVLLKFSTLTPGDSDLSFPLAITVDAQGRIIVAENSDASSIIQVFDSGGKLLFKFGARGTGDGQFTGPGDVAVDRQGNIYVADSIFNNRVQKFDPTGKFLMKFGSNGSGDGQFGSLGGIAVDGNGRIYTTDSSNGRVQVFDPVRAGSFSSSARPDRAWDSSLARSV